MSKILQMFSSRSFWSVVGLVLLAEMPVIQQLISPIAYHALELALGVIAVYFHINSNKIYTPANVTPPAPGETVTLTQPQ